MTKLEGMLGLARKAGALTYGTNNVLYAIRAKKAKAVLIASDASDGTKKLLCDKAAWYGADTHFIPLTMLQLAHAVGSGECAAAAITSSQFADYYYNIAEDSIKEAGKYGDNK